MVDLPDLVLPARVPTPGTRNVAALVKFNERRIEAEYAAVVRRPIEVVGIVGAGTMGGSIAAATVRAGLPVVITDHDAGALETLPRRMLAESLAAADPPFERDRAPDSLVRQTANPSEFEQCDLIVEALVEDFFVKERELVELERRLPIDTVLGSNTSTLSIGRLAARLVRPGRFCGIHFFPPVSQRRLVEIVPGPQSSPATVAAAVAFALALGKVPLIVPDTPGFLVNRLMLFYLSEALQLLTEGATIEAVERTATDFGMAIGPLSLIDQIGLDVILDCGWVLAGTLGERLVPSPPLVAMVKSRRLGQKSGAGFYSYHDDGNRRVAGKPDPAAQEIFARWGRPQQAHSCQSIAARLFLPMLVEATRLLAEGRIRDPRDIDLAVVFSCLGFPAARGGLLYWADTLRASRIVAMLEPLAKLGPRAQPTPLLLAMAEGERRFYPVESDEGL
ncbi:MAG: hypothetical protein HUU20_11575 [Pirellulales bacterium]|nr:hypothetical protein [Pirellulales bacterium]